MSETVTLDNGILKVKISAAGAEIQSVEKDGKNYIWRGDEKFWNGHAPVLFPYCGRIKDGKAIIDGKSYENLPSHGYAKRCEFEIVSAEKTQAAFYLEPNDYIRSVYPYNLSLRVLFKLKGSALETYYIVENNGEKSAFFNVGCHETFALSDDIENYSLLFEGLSEKVVSTGLNKGFLSGITYSLPLSEGGILPLDYKLFEDVEKERVGGVYSVGSLVCENLGCKRINLLKNGEEVLSVYTGDFNHLVVWTMDGAPFIAIEPWNGLPDEFNSNGDFSRKKSIDSVSAKSTKTFYHSVTFD